MRTLIGPMIYPDGTPMAGVTFILRAVRLNWSTDGTAPKSTEHRFTTNDLGDFVVDVAQGDWSVWFEMPGTSGAVEHLGPLVVEDGSTIPLGELLELSRDKSADLSISADWATKDYVIAQITIGAQPYDVAIDALNPGAGTAGQLYRVTANGLNVEAFTFEIKDYNIGLAGDYALMYRKPDGKPGLLPVPRTIDDDTEAVLGDVITVDMNAATDDITITFPAMTSDAQPAITICIECDNYILPHTLFFVEDGSGQTFNNIADSIATNRRRSFFIRPSANDNWRFN